VAIVCKQCAIELEENATVCAHCGAAIDSPAATNIESPDVPPPALGVPTFSSGNDLEGIGGWLILVALGLGIGPFVLLNGVYSDLRVFYGAQFQADLAPYPGLATFILFETVSNSVFLLALIALNILFYRKKKSFPGWMIAYLAFNCAVIVVDHLVSLRYNSHASPSAAIRSVVGTLVWIPYYVRSERVKVTFIN
jgi:Protein of unknown function (DUF2569)